jgi:hypothetical protein
MAVEVAKPRAASVRSVYRTFETVPGFGGTVTFTDVADSGSLHVVGIDWFSNATIGASFGGVYSAAYANVEEYDPDFVARVLRADAAPNEATFDNVVDLLDWLERD